ncbi:MAG: transporter permease [Firmicutes bacterium]|nr:transporter permease [Bacillota bacterium]
MDLLSYILKRVLQIIPVFIIATILIFFLMRLIPGDPALVMLGEKATPESLALLRSKMGLDQSYFTQFYLFFKNLICFDLGTSIKYKEPVLLLLGDKLMTTVWLIISSLFFSLLFSIIPGYYSGIHKDKPVDYIFRLLSLLSLATPAFWIGLVLLTLFSVQVNWFPVSGWGNTFEEHILGLILPGITQGIGVAAVLIRNLRNNVIDVKDSDYVNYARSKGLSNFQIGIHHILRNALIPTTTLLSMRIATMLSGSIVVETVFGLPGIGALLVNGIYARDYPVVQGVVLLFVLLVMVINLATDIIYSFLDPRVKLS